MKFSKKYIIFSYVILMVTLLSIYSIALRAKRNKPNIIFITLDSLRADHLGCYGYKRNTSPNIDFLSTKGTLFHQAISQASWTSASVSSIITSRYPSHELIEEGYSLSPKDNNLIKILKDNGYATVLFSNAEPILNITFCHIKDAFDIFHISDAKADKIIGLVNTWLNKRFQKPFFLWVYLFVPHFPYSADLHYFSDFINDNLYPHNNVSIAEDDGKKNEHYSFGVIPRHVAENGITDTSYYIAKYDGGIKFADEQIGRLLQVIHNKGLDKNTMIILFSDHGESMTEHDFYFNHSHFIYENLLRVPLIIIFPKMIPKKVIQQQVQLINIVPTVTDIIGIKNNKHMEGKSLLPLIKGEVKQLDTYAFSETSYFPSPRCIRTENWKLIYDRRPVRHNNKKYELYNLKEDPQELHNLILERIEIAASLRYELDRWSQTAKTHLLQARDNFSEQEKEKLKSLGYLQ